LCNETSKKIITIIFSPTVSAKLFTVKMVTTIKFVNEILKIRDLFPS